MTFNPKDDYEALGKLFYPSIEASGNVYYGQTRKLALDELFKDGFKSSVCYYGTYLYFNWSLGPLKDKISVSNLSLMSDQVYDWTCFPGEEYIEINYLDLSETVKPHLNAFQSQDHVEVFARYDLHIDDSTDYNILDSSNFNSFSKSVNLTNCRMCYMVKGYSPVVPNTYVSDQNVFLSSNLNYLYVRLTDGSHYNVHNKEDVTYLDVSGYISLTDDTQSDSPHIDGSLDQTVYGRKSFACHTQFSNSVEIVGDLKLLSNLDASNIDVYTVNADYVNISNELTVSGTSSFNQLNSDTITCNKLSATVPDSNISLSVSEAGVSVVGLSNTASIEVNQDIHFSKVPLIGIDNVDLLNYFEDSILCAKHKYPNAINWSDEQEQYHYKCSEVNDVKYSQLYDRFFYSDDLVRNDVDNGNYKRNNTWYKLLKLSCNFVDSYDIGKSMCFIPCPEPTNVHNVKITFKHLGSTSSSVTAAIYCGDILHTTITLNDHENDHEYTIPMTNRSLTIKFTPTYVSNWFAPVQTKSISRSDSTTSSISYIPDSFDEGYGYSYGIYTSYAKSNKLLYVKLQDINNSSVDVTIEPPETVTG
mgnify:CR=1 FL=1